MSKIREAFTDKKAFIGFLTAGDPSLDKTEEFMVQIEKAGAALIELGKSFFRFYCRRACGSECKCKSTFS